MTEARQRGIDRPEDLFAHIFLTLHFAGLHNSISVRCTTAMGRSSLKSGFQTFVHVLYDLAANTKYIRPLREEVELALQEEGGWSKAALGRMIKIDSFLKESQRMNGTSCGECTP